MPFFSRPTITKKGLLKNVPCFPSSCLFKFIHFFGTSLSGKYSSLIFCVCVFANTAVFTFCVFLCKLIWVCVSFMSVCSNAASQFPFNVWTQWAGVPMPALFRGASLTDIECMCVCVWEGESVCLPRRTFPPQPCSVKIDPSLPPIPFSFAPLCASALMRLWIGEAHRLQQMARAALVQCLRTHTHTCNSAACLLMNESPKSLKRQRGKCDTERINRKQPRRRKSQTNGNHWQITRRRGEKRKKRGRGSA